MRKRSRKWTLDLKRRRRELEREIEKRRRRPAKVVPPTDEELQALLEGKSPIAPPPKPVNTFRAKVVWWVSAILITLAFSAMVSIAFFQSVTVQESSMEPTLEIGDQFFIDRLTYRILSPKSGDIIAFRTNSSPEAAIHICRVIAGPEDTVQIVDGRVMVNGSVYLEAGDWPMISNPGIAQKPVELEEDEYFVLGDNRNNAEDSRHGEVGKVLKTNIVGKLWFTIYPKEKTGLIK